MKTAKLYSVAELESMAYKFSVAGKFASVKNQNIAVKDFLRLIKEQENNQPKI